MFVLEAIPLVVGAAIGWGLHRLRLGRAAQIAALLVASVLLGVAISALAGELEVSWAYIVWDAAQVAVGGGVALALLSYRAARTTVGE